MNLQFAFGSFLVLWTEWAVVIRLSLQRDILPQKFIYIENLAYRKAKELETMLTLEEAKFNFLAIHVGGLVNFLPLKLNRVSGRIIGVQSQWRWMFFATNFVLALLYILNFIRTLIQSKFSEEKVPINHFSVHIAYSFGMTADICRVAAFFFVQNEIVVVFNELYNNTSWGKKQCVLLHYKNYRSYLIRSIRTNFQEKLNPGGSHEVSRVFQAESYWRAASLPFQLCYHLAM